ncbi:phosphatidylglycerophosphatase A family protein [Shewanella psychrotolerans]|uniref:phosphatidylglycerophosphatase A family protein n=1 Tax=Shewanella psychrotolerans TaxID=2864206 RepID=UPI001C65CDBD|nr:phosphatidylglycerophosphatase A [Shewanella psychrotolerans]QYK02357.1 phosphatidylglycerophosphatase A [Shewanella psychrotolerans]
MNFRSTDPLLRRLSLSNPVHFLALGFGSGLLAKAPGTYGSLAAIPVYLLMANLSLPWYLGITLTFMLAGFYICDKASKDMGVHDHGAIVWDEVVGMLITLIAAPAGWGWLLLGFLLFRVFDILKPWPIKWLDAKVHGGFGIMIDDVLAGVFSFLCLQGLVFLVG